MVANVDSHSVEMLLINGIGPIQNKGDPGSFLRVPGLMKTPLVGMT